jgi:hypothetical protein
MQHLVRSHVERCLQDIWRISQVPIDDEGDYPFRAGTAACWVRVDSQVPVLVRVIGHAVEGVKRTSGLLRELNEINSCTRTTSVVWDEGVIRVTAMLHPEGLGRGSLRHALDAVTLVTNDIGPMIASVYGGTTPYEAKVSGHEVPKPD